LLREYTGGAGQRFWRKRASEATKKRENS
jgi:hypothetical protein